MAALEFGEAVGWLLVSLCGLGMLTLGAGGVAVLVAHLFSPPVEDDRLVLDLGTQPNLDRFLRRLAADVQAPVPTQVWLDPDVNAGLHRRGGELNLRLGLGLINTLDLAEFKAVVAHEYAHFGQSGSRLGHWVHRATYSLVRIVLVRDRFDNWLTVQRSKGRPLRSSFTDLLIVAAQQVRERLTIVLEWVFTAERSLGREMELDADAQGVREAGSDATISALWKSERATYAFEMTIDLIARLARQGHFVRDLFAVHGRRIAEFQAKLGDSSDPMVLALCRPYLPGEALHFPSGPSMVAQRFDSHPSLHERERSAKTPYVAHPRADDSTSAWVLFDDADRLREQLTRRTYQSLGFELPAVLVEPDQFEALVEREYAAVGWFGDHHGFFDNRFLMFGEFESLLGILERGEFDRATIELEAASWRGPAMAEFMARVALLRREIGQLEALCSVPLAQRDGSVELATGARAFGERAERFLDARRTELHGLASSFERGDRTLFAWAWLTLGPPEREQLVERCWFALRLQAQVLQLRPIGDELERWIQVVDQQGYARIPAVVHTLTEVAVRAHRELAATLHACEQASVPAVPTLERQTNLRALIGVELPTRADEAQPFERAVELLDALGHTVVRLNQIHDRLIGAMLDLFGHAERATQPDPEAPVSPSHEFDIVSTDPRAPVVSSGAASDLGEGSAGSAANGPESAIG